MNADSPASPAGEDHVSASQSPFLVSKQKFQHYLFQVERQWGPRSREAVSKWQCLVTVKMWAKDGGLRASGKPQWPWPSARHRLKRPWAASWLQVNHHKWMEKTSGHWGAETWARAITDGNSDGAGRPQSTWHILESCCRQPDSLLLPHRRPPPRQKQGFSFELSHKLWSVSLHGWVSLCACVSFS